ncbi:hypothetical protein MNBD_CHLOROFLEXI01-2632 [hydrothermal vent metagenome]|uniref:DUF3368 domain-containing protein n=1 Tax=hydrothermal vent metagenome TaxID=652676 RepID=A0A3B0V2F1_9ZZZZ
MPSLLVVISDATPLIALSKIKQLHYLADLFDTIYVPQAVYDEITVSGKGRSGAQEIAQASWIIVRKIEDKSRVEYLLTQLDIGEAEAIVLAQEVNAGLLLVDERKARAVAQRLGFNVIGTVGLLLLLKEQGKISRIRPLLDKLRSLNFRLSERVYNQVISQANE